MQCGANRGDPHNDGRRHEVDSDGRLDDSIRPIKKRNARRGTRVNNNTQASGSFVEKKTIYDSA